MAIAGGRRIGAKTQGERDYIEANEAIRKWDWPEAVCLLLCEELGDLERAIAAYRARQAR